MCLACMDVRVYICICAHWPHAPGCPEGRFSRAVGTSDMFTCKGGQGQHTTTLPRTDHLPTLAACSEGQFAHTKAMMECVNCHVGKYAGDQGSPLCTGLQFVCNHAYMWKLFSLAVVSLGHMHMAHTCIVFSLPVVGGSLSSGEVNRRS